MPEPFAPRTDRDEIQAALLEALPLCASLTEALALVELPAGTYHRWRQRDPAWAAQVDAAVAQREAGQEQGQAPPVPDPDTQYAVDLLSQQLAALEARLAALEEASRALGAAWLACAGNLRTMRGLQHLARTTEGSSRGPLTDLVRLLGAMGAPGPEAA